MLADGLYERFPRPDAALALHVTHDQETGTVGYTSGPAMAGSTAVDVTIRGKGGHGAAPHTTVDPIVLAALVVVDLQTIVSREVNPTQPCVVTVGSIHGGTRSNIIPDEVKLQLSLRAYREDVRTSLIDGIKRRLSGLARAHRAPEPLVRDRRDDPADGQHARTGRAGRPCVPEGARRRERQGGRPRDGGRGLRALRTGGRADVHVPGRHAPPRPARGGEGKGETLPSLHSASYFPEPSGQHSRPASPR